MDDLEKIINELNDKNLKRAFMGLQIYFEEQKKCQSSNLSLKEEIKIKIKNKETSKRTEFVNSNITFHENLKIMMNCQFYLPKQELIFVKANIQPISKDVVETG